MTLTQLKTLVAKWQERLRLEDWNIKVRWATPEEVAAGDWNGVCWPYVTTKEAEIAIINPISALSDEGRDTEYLVVHELLHLHHAPFQTKEGSMGELAEENIVHSIAILLLALDRNDETILGRKLSRRASLKIRNPIGKKSCSKEGTKGKEEESQTDTKGDVA